MLKVLLLVWRIAQRQPIPRCSQLGGYFIHTFVSLLPCGRNKTFLACSCQSGF